MENSYLKIDREKKNLSFSNSLNTEESKRLELINQIDSIARKIADSDLLFEKAIGNILFLICGIIAFKKEVELWSIISAFSQSIRKK